MLSCPPSTQEGTESVYQVFRLLYALTGFGEMGGWMDQDQPSWFGEGRERDGTQNLINYNVCLSVSGVGRGEDCKIAGGGGVGENAIHI